MKPPVGRFRHYPPAPPALAWLDRVAVWLGTGGPVRCLVCGRLTVTRIEPTPLRETCQCRRCGATNRHRQIAYVACEVAAVMRQRRVPSLRALARIDDLVVYNTEARGPIHAALAGMKRYVASEYFAPPHKSGDLVDGIRCEDLLSLSFGTESVDLILSSDVFEHVPDAYRAHAEVYRVLRHGGRHVFTVPFDFTEFLDDERAVVDGSGTTRFLKEPLYHIDPIRPQEGALVYRIFSLEMLVRLRQVGFRTHLYHLHHPLYGILGVDAIVFEAIKP